MALHSTRVKRIVAKEFLLIVGCVVAVLLVALFGWVRNGWYTIQAESAANTHRVQTLVLDSLYERSVPALYETADLFVPAYTSKLPSAVAAPPSWIIDAAANRKRLYDNLLRDGYELPDFGIFTIKVSDKSKRAALYAEVKKEGYDVPDFETFSEDIAGDLLPSTPKPPFDPNKPFEVIQPDPLNILPPPPLKWNRNKVFCFVSALKDQGYFTPERLRRYAIATHIEASDSSGRQHFLIAAEALTSDTVPYSELREAVEYLKERNILHSDFDICLRTLQNKPIPPTQETLDALAKQRTLVAELVTKKNNARANLWSADKQWAVVKWAAIVLLVLVYPLRLLMLGTRWALRTLKT